MSPKFGATLTLLIICFLRLKNMVEFPLQEAFRDKLGQTVVIVYLPMIAKILVLDLRQSMESDVEIKIFEAGEVISEEEHARLREAFVMKRHADGDLIKRFIANTISGLNEIRPELAVFKPRVNLFNIRSVDSLSGYRPWMRIRKGIEERTGLEKLNETLGLLRGDEERWERENSTPEAVIAGEGGLYH